MYIYVISINIIIIINLCIEFIKVFVWGVVRMKGVMPRHAVRVKVGGVKSFLITDL